MALSSPRTDAILALRSQNLSILEIAAAVPCAANTVIRALRQHGLSGKTRSSRAVKARPDAFRVASPLSPYDAPQRHTQDAPPRSQPSAQVTDLRRHGLSHRQIARRTGLSRAQVGEALVRARAAWRHDPKRRHEAVILALACEALQPVARQGVAIALTGPEVAIHVDALRHVVSRLIVPERDPTIYMEAIAALTEPPAIPVDVVLGDFWTAAAATDGPIAFLDYDGMKMLPANLGTRLNGLANRLTDPAVVRLTTCLSGLGGERQLPLAIDALRGMPGREIVRLQADVTPWERRPRMLTVVAVLRATAHDPNGGGP